jgi:hypothetical protein
MKGNEKMARYVVTFENLLYGPFMTRMEAEAWAKKEFVKNFKVGFIWSTN